MAPAKAQQNAKTKKLKRDRASKKRQQKTLQTRGFCTQRHLQALGSEDKYFPPQAIHVAHLSTGITVEYVIHEINPPPVIKPAKKKKTKKQKTLSPKKKSKESKLPKTREAEKPERPEKTKRAKRSRRSRRSKKKAKEEEEEQEQEEEVQEVVQEHAGQEEIEEVAEEEEEDEEAEEQLEEVRVVMTMGFLGGKEAWSNMLDFLHEKGLDGKKRLKVLTFDNRGIRLGNGPFGKYSTSQMAKDTVALMDHVGWKTAHCVGISMGGMICLELAATFPKRVDSLTLIVTTRGRFFPEISCIPSILRMFTSPNPDSMVPAMLRSLYPPEFLAKQMEDSPESVGDAITNRYIELFAKNKGKNNGFITLSGWFGQCMACFAHYVSDERLYHVRDQGFPILIIGARQDRLIPFHHTETLMELLSAPHVRSVVYDDAGHGLFLQYEEEIVDEIRELLINTPSGHGKPSDNREAGRSLSSNGKQMPEEDEEMDNANQSQDSGGDLEMEDASNASSSSS